jgi:hypothetical protein
MSAPRAVDWHAWHAPYRDPASALSRRLAIVQEQISKAVHAAPPGAIRLVSVCAGQGHDVIGALREHPRRTDVVARLVELDPRNVQAAREAAATAGLTTIDVVCDDATLVSSYQGALPADVLVFCGVLGNIEDQSLRGVINRLPELCAPNAMVVWTRHRRPPDMSGPIRSYLADAGFEESIVEADQAFAVGAHQLVVEPRPPEETQPLFAFVTDPLWLRRDD